MVRHKILHGILILSTLSGLTGFGPDRQAEEIQLRITQVDTSAFPKVTVFVSVTDANGDPVGVAAERIRLAENGVEIPPDQIQGAGEVSSLTTLLVMDVSSSMLREGKLEAAKTAAKEFVEQLRPGDRAGLMSFSHKIDYVQPITDEREAVLKAIDALEAEGDTAMYDALSEAISLLGSIEGRKAIVALTDGLDNISQAKPESVLAQIDAEGLSISTIGLGDPDLGASEVTGLDEEALEHLAENAGGIYGYANDVESLVELYRAYAIAFKSEYELSYLSPANLRDGVNRALSVYLADVPASLAAGGQGAARYNPGGLVPEVSAAAPWGVFAWMLLGLAVLLLLPGLINRSVAATQRARPVSGRKKKPRIKLKD